MQGRQHGTDAPSTGQVASRQLIWAESGNATSVRDGSIGVTEFWRRFRVTVIAMLRFFMRRAI